MLSMTLIIFNNSCDEQQNQFQNKFAYGNFLTVLKMHFLSQTKGKKNNKTNNLNKMAHKHATNQAQRHTSK